MASKASCTPSSTSTLSGQRKRAFDALERRFAAETELRLERDRPVQDTPNKKPTPVPPPKNAPPKREETKDSKGSFSFPTSIPRRDAPKSSDGEVHPVYSEISALVIDENLLAADGSEDTSRHDAVSRVVNSIVQKGDGGSKFVKGGKSLKIDNWILLDNFVPKDNTLAEARLKALRSHSKRSRKHISRRQHRKLGTFDLPKEYHNFDLFEPMHQVWKEYILELVKENGKKKLVECLLMADLHGAFVIVVECKVVAFKGVSGVMIRETAETFGIICRDNRFIVVPKVGSVFRFQAKSWKVTLYGDKLSERMLTQKDTRQHK